MKIKTKPKIQAAPRLLSNGPAEPSREEIAQAAYYLWEQNGRPQNQDVQFWLQAKAQLGNPQAARGLSA